MIFVIAEESLGILLVKPPSYSLLALSLSIKVVVPPPVAKPWSSSPPAKSLGHALVNYLSHVGNEYYGERNKRPVNCLLGLCP